MVRNRRRRHMWWCIAIGTLLTSGVVSILLQIKSSAGATIVHRIEAILDVAASRPVAEVLEDVVAAGGEAPQYERGRRQYQVLVRNYKRSIIISTARQWTIAVNDEGRVISCVARDVFVAP